jgi:hypothetical protein
MYNYCVTILWKPLIKLPSSFFTLRTFDRLKIIKFLNGIVKFSTINNIHIGNNTETKNSGKYLDALGMKYIKNLQSSITKDIVVYTFHRVLLQQWSPVKKKGTLTNLFYLKLLVRNFSFHPPLCNSHSRATPPPPHTHTQHTQTHIHTAGGHFLEVTDKAKHLEATLL